MAYVQVDASGVVNGEFASPQSNNPNYLELPDNDPRVQAWRNTSAWADHQQKAFKILAATDNSMMRIVEAVVLGENVMTSPDVVAFVNYRRNLRSIISAKSGDASVGLPAKPPYPAGT